MAQNLARKRRKLSPSESSDSETQRAVDYPPAIPYANASYIHGGQWNLEQKYEAHPRKRAEENENTRLPIITLEGKVERLDCTNVKNEDTTVSEDENTAVAQRLADIKYEEPNVSGREQILEAKEELARIASLVNENPEEHAGAFRTLAQIASSTNFVIKKLALATQLSVYKDIIPGYRIRPISEADKAEKVSKEVRRMRSFEQSLIGSYQIYVNELFTYAKSSRGDESSEVKNLATVAVSCACALLLAVPHFNFRGDLIKILVDKLSGKRIDGDFAKCRETLETLFRNDQDGAPALDTVTMLAKMMKSREYNVHESVINTFLHLRLLSEFSSKGSQNHVDRPTSNSRIKGKKMKAKHEFRTKRNRKLEKERKVVEKEFKEADAIVSHEERDKNQAETLKLIFVTYFRILKTRSPYLMGAVLEGLAKYAHLINQDFFGDLLEALKDLIADAFSTLDDSLVSDSYGEDSSAVSKRDFTRQSLLCITTAFALLEGQDASKAAASLHLDLSFFITHLYRSLHALSLNPDIELSSKSMHLPDPHSPILSSPPKINIATTTVLLLRALSSTLTPPLSPKSIPPIRIAAFTHQLLTCSLQFPEKSARALMGLMNNVVKTHRRKVAGLWTTEERRGDGEFDALKTEVEGSNPFAGTVWEGELLRLHWCPAVRDGWGSIEAGVRGIVK